MPYFKPLNLLYLHIPKTGGTSIEEFFYNKCNMVKNETNIYGSYYNKKKRLRVENNMILQHFTYNEIEKKKEFFDIEFGEKNRDMKILVSVRNPFDRIVSEIFWRKKVTVNENTTKDEFYEILHKFLYADVENPMNNHRIPQYQFMLNKENKMINENIMIVKTETLKKDMQSFGYHDFDNHLNINHFLKHQKINYRDLLNKKSIELIVNYYIEDFKYFGYSTDLYSEKLNVRLPLNNKITNATIVTGFINTKNKYRNITDYISFGEKLLKIDTPKVVYMDPETYNDYFKERMNEFPNTHFIMFELCDLYLYKHKDSITDFNLETNNSEKDTMEYIFVQCNKTEWVRKAIDMNVFKTDQFIWLDFGIYHMIQDEELFEKNILKMVEESYSNLRIATCKYREYVCPYDVYKRLTWNFAGSVFGGDCKSLTIFADIVKNKILETIETKKTIMWELCFWYLVKDVVPDLYDCYICGHDYRILELY